VKWVGEKVAGGFVAGGGGLLFDGILSLLGGDKPDPTVQAMQKQLGELLGQLTQLQGTMSVALAEIEKTKYAALAAPAKTLENLVIGAQTDFLDALRLAGDPAHKEALDTAVNNLKKKVDDAGGLAVSFPVVYQAIVHSSFADKPMYQALSNMVTAANTKLFTWRDSSAIDNVFQYLLGLQALQFNLIVQVRQLEQYPQDVIYQNFVQPLFGDQASLQAYLQTGAPTSETSWLKAELAAELQRVPNGAVVQIPTNLMWSIDMLNGTKHLIVLPSGPGYPSCRGRLPSNYYNQQVPVKTTYCLDSPTHSVGLPPRAPDSPAAVLADHLASQGNGTPDQWNIPTMAQWQGLFSGATSPDGWLEKTSGSDPTTCNADHAGTTNAISDPKSCIWPRVPFWVADTANARTQNEDNFITKDYFHFLYAWHFVFFNAANAQHSECLLSTNQLDSSEIAGFLDKKIHTLTPTPIGCGPWLTLVRAIPANERYYFPL
jgi:hypothetical protein